MTEAVKLLTFISIIFVIILLLAGSFGGALGDVVYYIAFLAPILIGYRISERLKYEREEEKGLAESPDGLLEFDMGRASLLLPLVAPTVTLIMLLSILSRFIFSLIGASNAPIADDGIFKMLVNHALIPSVLEEVLFRYIPMKLVMPYSRRWCVFYSAFCFALIHCSFAQMPYAFVAGVLFMVIDVALGSIWPSVILHFLNNAMSIVSMKYCSSLASVIIFISLMLLISLVSLTVLYRKRTEYKELFGGALDKGEGLSTTYAPFALAIICCLVAAASI